MVLRYIASLVGFGPRDLKPAKRAACLAFAIVSAPFQFIPLLMAARSKAGERGAVAELTRYLSDVERESSVQREREPSVPPKEREPIRRASTSGA